MNSSATVKFVKVKVFKERFVQSFLFQSEAPGVYHFQQRCISLLQTSLLTNQNPAFIVGIRYSLFCSKSTTVIET